MGIKMTHSGSLGLSHSITVSEEYLEHAFKVKSYTKTGPNELTIRTEDEQDLLDAGMKNLTKVKTLIDKEADKAYSRMWTKLTFEANKQLKDAINQWKSDMKTKAEGFFHMPQHGALYLLNGDGLPAMIDSLQGTKVKTKYTADDAIKINVSIKTK